MYCQERELSLNNGGSSRVYFYLLDTSKSWHYDVMARFTKHDGYKSHVGKYTSDGYGSLELTVKLPRDNPLYRVWFAVATIEPLTEHLPLESMEMGFSVIEADNNPVVTHIGITRGVTFMCAKGVHKNISMIMHGFVATCMLEHGKRYMITRPADKMREIMRRNVPHASWLLNQACAMEPRQVDVILREQRAIKELAATPSCDVTDGTFVQNLMAHKDLTDEWRAKCMKAYESYKGKNSVSIYSKRLMRLANDIEDDYEICEASAAFVRGWLEYCGDSAPSSEDLVRNPDLLMPFQHTHADFEPFKVCSELRDAIVTALRNIDWQRVVVPDTRLMHKWLQNSVERQNHDSMNDGMYWVNINHPSTHAPNAPFRLRDGKRLTLPDDSTYECAWMQDHGHLCNHLMPIVIDVAELSKSFMTSNKL